MTAKEFVKQHMPEARCERHLSGQIPGLRKPYWLIRTGRNQSMYFASSTRSESNAWVTAKNYIKKSLAIDAAVQNM
jgi:hypothetical protein